MVIRKGSVYWVHFPGKGSEPLGMRPGLVIQSDVLNDSKISTVIMVAIPRRSSSGNYTEM